MSTGLIEIMKRASIDAMESNQPCDLRYGTVTSVSPLKVRITDQFILPASLLVVPQHLTDYTVKADLDTSTDGELKTIKIYNSLKVNDKVALLRKAGGQSYFILDRV